jgi:hypothetical protein
MKISEEKIFVLTSPLFWLWVVIFLINEVIKKTLDITGIYDWYYVLFKFNKLSKRGKGEMVFLMEKRLIKLFWLKRKAWSYVVTKIKEENAI